jgi:hypothetical protein
VESYGLDPNQIETDGKGWKEPLGSDPAQNRRVEVQVFVGHMEGALNSGVSVAKRLVMRWHHH